MMDLLNCRLLSFAVELDSLVIGTSIARQNPQEIMPYISEKEVFLYLLQL